MVHRKAGQRKTLKFWLIGIFALATIVAFGANALIIGTREPEAEELEVAESQSEPEPEPVKAVNFQPVVEAWAAGESGNKSILIYDLDREEVAASYNMGENYNTASLYKLFVVYEGYKRVQSGEYDGNTIIVNGNTILKCLDLAIRESNSPCAEKLWAMIGHDTLDTIIENEWGIKNSDISRLISNAKDITSIMQKFYEHADIADEVLIAQMKDSFLNQPITTYDWRQGLPSGFSSDVEVYNKVGWAYNSERKRWDIYHDAAIVKFKKSDRAFIITVLTNYIPYQDIRNLAQQLESEFNKY